MAPSRLPLKRIVLIALAVIVVGLVVGAVILSRSYAPENWGDFDVLAERAPRPPLPSYGGKTITPAEYRQWIDWGQEWFRNETFGNERLWTDVVGFLDGTIDVPDGRDGWKPAPFFRFFIQAIDALDGVRGNLYSGNGGGYTNDLVVVLPHGAMLDRTFPLPDSLHTGLDVEAGAAWPLGVVPKPVTDPDEMRLPYLLDPARYAGGPDGVGPLPRAEKFRVGVTCALCHYSLDIDWDGHPDLRSAKPGDRTPGSAYHPEDAWAIGNQDIALGPIFAMSANTIAGFANSAHTGGTTAKDARDFGAFVKAGYERDPEAVKIEVDRGLLAFPRGYADDTPDGLHDPLQFPSLFTYRNWPYNYDGVMLNASDRNNNVWTTGLDLTQLVALCSDRGGRTAKLIGATGVYSPISAHDYAEIVVAHAPAVVADPSRRDALVADILGESDGMPGLLRNDATVLVKGVPFAVPGALYTRKDNAARVREPAAFGSDGAARGPMTALLGTRVVTPDEIAREIGADALARKYGLNRNEFVTEAVSMMLDWVQPPANRTALLANARAQGLVAKGYAVFKDAGCANCHAGPFFTDNRIVPLRRIGTDTARAAATAPIQRFLAPIYSPRTGEATGGGIVGVLAGLFAGKDPGYKTVTLRYLWGSAPYLHDGGVGVALRPDAAPAGDDLPALLRRPDADKIAGIAQILNVREARPSTWLRPNAALSLQALLLRPEREKVIRANAEKVHRVPGSSDRISIASMHIRGVGHEYWIDDVPGGDRITALVAFLLALDDDPGR